MPGVNNLLLLFALFIKLLVLARTDSLQTDTAQQIKGLAEGGDIVSHSSRDETHVSREHENNVQNKSPTTQSLNNTQSNIPVENVTSTVFQPLSEKPITNSSTSEKNNAKQSQIKNGASSNFSISSKETLSVVKNATAVSINGTTETLTNTSIPQSIPKKPLTVSSDSDEVNADAKFSKSSSEENDRLLRKKSNRADYVIPIVAVILSVPLVAIIISFIYKRGTDWWEHRNYRRMDFLIEGMYNN